MPFHPMPHTAPRRDARSKLWALPLLAAVLFVAGVIVWAWRSELDDAADRRATMIADALSTEAQLRGRVDVEMAHLQDLAKQIPKLPRNAKALAANTDVAEGLRRLWLSVTWLDANNRIVAHVPEQHPMTDTAIRETLDSAGVSAHLVQPAGADRLVVRYSAALLLRRGAPWWLTRKYDVELIDSTDQAIASVDEVPLRLDPQVHESYKVQVGGNMPGTYLELTLREVQRPFWRSLPIVLVGGFLGLMLVATALLRRQMRQISRAEDAWRTEAAWRQAMEDSALVGLRARDADGRILFVNRTFCDMVGLPAQALVGLAPPMPYWPPESLAEVMQRHKSNLAGNAPRDGYEAVWRHQDGHQLNVMVFESPLIDAYGTQIGWMGSIIDITARKQLEERQRHQAEAMATQSRLTTLGEVASALAHQLNQPLTAVIGYNAGLQRMLGQDASANPSLLKALKSQGEQAAEAGRIVQRIREFLTRRAPQREPCDLAAVARRAVELLQRDLQRQQIQIDWEVQPELPPVFADPILIEQVLINLVRNAADALAAQGSGGRIQIATTLATPQQVRLAVGDDGPGLEGRSIEQLTTAFYSTKADGMGMGLAICRSIIELHHGSMEADASPWGGARLSFSLPVFDTTLHTTMDEETTL
ncbi:adaptive-response sensory-kinase SasA [Comamonadaceae bacterium OS-1]|nr:adaptive-response sensory-kinase SasA [Comamonadaceae bacterium OS-1]